MVHTLHSYPAVSSVNVYYCVNPSMLYIQYYINDYAMHIHLHHAYKVTSLLSFNIYSSTPCIALLLFIIYSLT